MSSSGLVSLRLRGFRAARDVTIELGSLCALVGDANAGKSTLIAAIRALLDPSCPVGTADLAHSGSRGARIEGVLASGARCRMRATPTHLERVLPAEVPAVLYLPAELRAAGVLPGAGERPPGAARTRG
jgi:energy-coupling factor transporter ATP-binding protein EcfA2